MTVHDVYAKAKRLIPGGTQLLSKRPEQFAPGVWPAYFKNARGAEVVDLDGLSYLDMSIFGIGACVLGFADPDVDASVKNAIDCGTMCSLNSVEELELAELLINIHPWSEMARYARTGGEAMAIAVRIARAYTHRDKVAFCGYHGWHDWYLSANLADDENLDGHLLQGLQPTGVPRSLKGTALPFRFNHIHDLEKLAHRVGSELAAIVLEPVRTTPPTVEFVTGVMEIARVTGAVVIVDEITSGFRLHGGGAHLLYDLEPDIAVFAKAISNGYPMAAIIGREQIMQASQTTFISSTYWTERIGPTAALATVRKYRDADVGQHLIKTGKKVQEIWHRAAEQSGLRVRVDGIPPLSHFEFDCPEPRAAATLFTQLMIDCGILAGTRFYASWAHRDEHLERYAAGTIKAFLQIRDAVDSQTVKDHLKGDIAHSGFTRVT